MPAIKTQRAVGEDNVWKDAPVAKKFNFKGKIDWESTRGPVKENSGAQ